MLTMFIAVFGSLFSMVNPLGAMPMYAALTANDDEKRKAAIALKASIFFVFILVLFYFVGSSIMSFFGISFSAMRIAGGFVIFGSGLALMRGDAAKKKEEVHPHGEKEDISLTPLAMPMLSGPGSISMLIAYNAKAKTSQDYLATVAAIIAVGAVTYFILRATPYIMEKLGPSGINSISKIFGFFVMAIGVQYVINGVKPLLG